MGDGLPFGYALRSPPGLDTDFVLLDQRRFAMTWLSSYEQGLFYCIWLQMRMRRLVEGKSFLIFNGKKQEPGMAPV